MPTNINVLQIRKTLGRDNWYPFEPYGPDGWCGVSRDHSCSVIVSCASFDDVEYVHASIANTDHETIPSYHMLVLLHKAVFGDGYAYQVFAPPQQHVNIHEAALHLFGRLDGKPVLPEFGIDGTI